MADSFQKSSPLQSLLRRASSRRTQLASSTHLSPPRSPGLPPSPLLHSHFRSSIAADDQSSHRRNDSLDAHSYLQPDPLRQSWQSTDTDTTTTPEFVLNWNNKSDGAPAVVVTASEPSSQYGVVHPNFHEVDSAPGFPSFQSSNHDTLVAGHPRPTSPSNEKQPDLLNPQTPQDFLHLGIQHHEANRLDRSAECFEKSAKLNGGCGVGMLMYGLTLRHGWGCPKNEKSGLHWLQKAAEAAVNDLESANSGVEATAVQGELVIAIYEVGQSFLQGWGVPKDKKMAVSYFRVAARLGDPDAQQSLAFCLANGKGCKKDRKEAAKWYRAAVAQGGISDVGLAWIYKDKLQ